MADQTLIIPAKIDARTFRRFAVFDTFCRQRLWRAPALFTVLMLAFSITCFAFQGSHSGAALLGTVLLVIGLGLPVVYVASFLLSVRNQSQRLKLDGIRTVYTIHLCEKHIQVVSDSETAQYQWEQIFCAYRKPDCIYLYVTSQRAFLIPVHEQDSAVWDLLVKKLPIEKRKSRF